MTKIKKSFLKKIKKEYHKNGFFIIKNFFKKTKIQKINYDIKQLVHNNNNKIDIYYDSKNKLRRIERLYDKTATLKEANIKIINFIETSLGKKLMIFKDKFNAKPPGGEGFNAHFDGVFYYKSHLNKNKKGWYEYNKYFLNVLVALDKCDSLNGTIEIGRAFKGNFLNLYKYTKKNNTPDIQEKYEKKIKFKKIYLKPGDCVFFENTCPHKSKKNRSKQNRRILYYTYTLKNNKNLYKKYFIDKKKSKNKTSKSLSGEI